MPKQVPANLYDARPSDFYEWWLEVRCDCGRCTSFPMRLMRLRHKDMLIWDMVRKMRCSSCKRRPDSVFLVDKPDIGQKYRNGSPFTRIDVLKALAAKQIS